MNVFLRRMLGIRYAHACAAGGESGNRFRAPRKALKKKNLKIKKIHRVELEETLGLI